MELLHNEFPEVDQIAANVWLNEITISYGREYLTNTSIVGITPANVEMEGQVLLTGRFINETDLAQQRKVILLDKSASEVLFLGADPVGKAVKLNNISFTVIGVYDRIQKSYNSTCNIPLSTAQLIFKANSPYVDRIVFSVNEITTDQQMETFEKRLRNRLAAEHKFSPTDESALWIFNRMENYKDTMFIFNGISIFIWIIGLGTLLAGVVGVSNIMLVTVQERTFEFGIRKALGAKPSSVIRLILTESVLITAAFGYIGMVLGVFTMELVNKILSSMPTTGEHQFNMFLNPTLNLSVAVSATIVLVIAGLIAGYVPARRAAQLKTIDALRYNK